MIESLETIAADVARSLATFEMVGGAAIVSTPLMYPGGSSVIVQISQHGDRFFLSDLGMGRREAHLLGGDRLFGKIAANTAGRFGIAFDSEAFFIAEAGQDDLVPVVALIANASRTAVEFTAYRVAEKAAADARGLMREKLLKAFDEKFVAIGYDFLGASETWKFDAAVVRDDHVSLFQVITPASQSVYSAVSRFVDVSDVELRRPRLVAVLENRAATQHLKLVERSASTIELQADVNVWKRAAA